jgi:small subunit ribosomal protein S4
LTEKQKLRNSYGMMEKQFSSYFAKARHNPGVTGQNLLQLLERRLDNVVFRMNFAQSRKQARQFVLHGHFTVNERKVDIPSFSVRSGDVVQWKNTESSGKVAEVFASGQVQRPTPGWLSIDSDRRTGRVISLPEPQDSELQIDTRLIVEFYNS